MMERSEIRCARSGAALCALLFGLSVGVDRAFADDVTDVYADDVYAEPTDEVSEEVADDVPEEYADDAPEEYADDGGEEADENTGPSFGRIAWDVTLLRPLNFIRLVVGCALTIPITLLAQPGGIDNVQNMADYFVGQPYWDTFERPLGKF